MTEEERAQSAPPEPEVAAEVEDVVVDHDVDQEVEAAAVEEDGADIATVMAERDEYLAQLQRVAADFENFRKRVMRDKADEVARAAESLVTKLLDVLDTFDLAVAHGGGFEQGHTQLVDLLAKEGLERIDPGGDPFDPAEHDAVAHEPVDGDDEPTVSDVLRAGWRWKGRVLRPAMVKVRG